MKNVRTRSTMAGIAPSGTGRIAWTSGTQKTETSFTADARLAGACPKQEKAAVGQRCSVYYPQLLRLWEQTGKSLDEL